MFPVWLKPTRVSFVCELFVLLHREVPRHRTRAAADSRGGTLHFTVPLRDTQTGFISSPCPRAFLGGNCVLQRAFVSPGLFLTWGLWEVASNWEVFPSKAPLLDPETRWEQKAELLWLQMLELGSFRCLPAWNTYFLKPLERFSPLSLRDSRVNFPGTKEALFQYFIQEDKDTDSTEGRLWNSGVKGEVDVFSAMDVTVYPPPPQPLTASEHTRLGQLSYSEPAFGTNKVRLNIGAQSQHEFHSNYLKIKNTFSVLPPWALLLLCLFLPLPIKSWLITLLGSNY